MEGWRDLIDAYSNCIYQNKSTKAYSTLKIQGKVRNGDPSFAGCHDLKDIAIKMVQIERHINFQLVYCLLVLALTLPMRPPWLAEPSQV